MSKKLGKIDRAEFGRVHDRPFLFGLKLSFSSNGWGVSDGLKYTVNLSKNCNWKSKDERSKAIEKINNFTYKLLEEANVNHISQLVGMPVEVEFSGEGNIGSTFKDFRILKEVL